MASYNIARWRKMRIMKRNVTTYNGMSVSTQPGRASVLCHFLDVDFLKKNLSNNLHISKLFIFSLSLSLSYSETDAHARQDTYFPLTDKVLADYFSANPCLGTDNYAIYSILATPQPLWKEAAPYGGIRHGNQPCLYAAAPFRITQI